MSKRNNSPAVTPVPWGHEILATTVRAKIGTMGSKRSFWNLKVKTQQTVEISAAEPLKCSLWILASDPDMQSKGGCQVLQTTTCHSGDGQMSTVATCTLDEQLWLNSVIHTKATKGNGKLTIKRWCLKQKLGKTTELMEAKINAENILLKNKNMH